MVMGYLHPQYLESLSEWGTPRELTGCGGWILERPIPTSADRDAMGCYPLFLCRDWPMLASDLQNLGDALVSLALVTDPFGEYQRTDLERTFDVVIPFKEHYVVDLHRPINEIVSRHHRYYVRKVAQNVQVDICEEPIRYIDEWVDLYAALAQRHNVTGIRAFSKAAFLKQLSIPGLVMFRAIHHNTMVGAALCFLQDDTAYGHLMGISETGHELGVSYALYWSHLSYLSGKVDWLDWGGTSGLQNSGTDGLSQFKRGWSTGTRTAYFCGKILNQKRYTALMEARELPPTDYFPAYRSGEMG
jgi:hypothetical protein